MTSFYLVIDIFLSIFFMRIACAILYKLPRIAMTSFKGFLLPDFVWEFCTGVTRRVLSTLATLVQLFHIFWSNCFTFFGPIVSHFFGPIFLVQLFQHFWSNCLKKVGPIVRLFWAKFFSLYFPPIIYYYYVWSSYFNFLNIFWFTFY